MTRDQSVRVRAAFRDPAASLDRMQVDVLAYALVQTYESRPYTMKSNFA